MGKNFLQGVSLSNTWLVLETIGLVSPVIVILVIASSTGLSFVGREVQNSVRESESESDSESERE